MNTNTKTELAAVTATQSAVDAMAVVTLSPEKYAAEVYQPFNERLAAAIEGVKAIDYDIKTTAGMAVAVKARATFRDLRTEADNERKERKAPITKIGKLLESHFDMVEERSRPLEALFDADIQAEIERKEAEKAAKIAAERARTEAIANAIQAIRDIPISMAGKSSQDISRCIAGLVGTIPDEFYQEFIEQAQAARHESLDKLAAMETAQRGVEIEAESQRQESARQALAAEEDRKTEAARIEQERATIAAQRAENERIANEQAVERQRLANLAAAQEAEATRIREQAAANLKAEQDALAEQVRIQREAAAEQQRQMASQQAEFEALRASFAREQERGRQRAEDAAKMEADHAEALWMDVQFDADREAERARLQAVADQRLADNRTPAFSDTQISDSLSAYADVHPDEPELTDDDITEWGAECGLDKSALIVRLRAYIASAEVSA